MDWGLVFLSAIVGGVLGGVGGLVGWLVGQQFPSKAKTVAQAFSIVGVVTAIVITPAIRDFIFDEAGTSVAPASDTLAEYDRFFRSDPLFGKIADGWPSEYRAFLEDIVSRHGRIDGAEAQQMGFDFTAGIRRANASNAYLAGDAGLREYFSNYRDLLRDIRAEDGDVLCGAMVRQGPIALSGREDRYMKPMQRLGIITMDLLLEGRRQRDGGAAPINPPSQQALEALDAYLMESTGEGNLFERMRRGTGTEQCSDALHVMSALAEFAPDQPDGRAIRIAIFHEILAG